MSFREPFFPSRIASLTEVEPAAWNALTANQPLLSHEFLLAMESSGSVGPGTEIEGPAIVEMSVTTIVVQPGQRGRVDDYGSFVITV